MKYDPYLINMVDKTNESEVTSALTYKSVWDIVGNKDQNWIHLFQLHMHNCKSLLISSSHRS